jgi:hypothetical protein
LDKRIFETMSDVGRGTNLIGLALMSISSAALFVDRAIASRKPNRKSTPDTTIIDMLTKTQSN